LSYYAAVLHRLLLILLLPTLAFADTKVKHHSGCPLDFRVPKGWSVDVGSNCSFTIMAANPMRMIDMRGYTGSNADLEPRYRAIEKETARREVSFGEFRGFESLKGRAYLVVSNDDLLIEMRSVLAPPEVLQSIAASLRATGKSAQNKKHKKLFPRACGVKLDYPLGWFVDRGQTKESRCEATLRSAVPPRVSATADVSVTAVKKKPLPFGCVAQQELDSHRTELFTGEGWVGASMPFAERSEEEAIQLIFSDGCERTVVISNPSDQMRDLAIQTIRFKNKKCENRLTSFPVCAGN
jgi:hypothetical protein